MIRKIIVRRIRQQKKLFKLSKSKIKNENITKESDNKKIEYVYSNR